MSESKMGRCREWTSIGILLMATLCGACDVSSRELHICLNIYLERDFPLIETIVNGQMTARGRVILEGMDLDNICDHISSLSSCYWGLLPECLTLWQYDRFVRVMDVLDATREHLCQGNKDNLKDLLLTSGCLIRSRPHTSNCTGFDWTLTWRRVLRMQEGPRDTCPALASYWKCLAERVAGVTCGPHTADVYRRLVDVWMRRWCAADLSRDAERRYFYAAAEGREEAARRERERRRAEQNRASRRT